MLAANAALVTSRVCLFKLTWQQAVMHHRDPNCLTQRQYSCLQSASPVPSRALGSHIMAQTTAQPRTAPSMQLLLVPGPAQPAARPTPCGYATHNSS